MGLPFFTGSAGDVFPFGRMTGRATAPRNLTFPFAPPSASVDPVTLATGWAPAFVGSGSASLLISAWVTTGLLDDASPPPSSADEKRNKKEKKQKW